MKTIETKASIVIKDKGLLLTQTDSEGRERTQVQKKINGINKRCFCIERILEDNS